MAELTQSLVDDLNARLVRAERRVEDLTKALKSERRDKRLIAQERDQLKTSKPADQSDPKAEELQQQLQATQAELSRLKHLDLFRREAVARGAKPEHVEDLYTLLRLQPGDEPVKPEDFHAALDTAKEGRYAWAFQSSHQESEAPPAPPPDGTPPRPPAGGPEGQGRAPSNPPAGTVQYTMEDVSTPDWQQKRPDLVTALKEGRAKLRS